MSESDVKNSYWLVSFKATWQEEIYRKHIVSGNVVIFFSTVDFLPNDAKLCILANLKSTGYSVDIDNVYIQITFFNELSKQGYENYKKEI